MRSAVLIWPTRISTFVKSSMVIFSLAAGVAAAAPAPVVAGDDAAAVAADVTDVPLVAAPADVICGYRRYLRFVLRFPWLPFSPELPFYRCVGKAVAIFLVRCRVQVDPSSNRRDPRAGFCAAVPKPSRLLPCKSGKHRMCVSEMTTRRSSAVVCKTRRGVVARRRNCRQPTVARTSDIYRRR